MYRQYARSKRGKRGNIRISDSNWGIVALCAGKLIAHFKYEAMMNGVLFERCFEKTLLKNLPKKRIIIMDNAAFHPKELLV